MTNVIITPLDPKKEAQKIIEVFVAAFEKDPLMDYFFGNEYHSLAKYLWQYVGDLTPILDLLLILNLSTVSKQDLV